MHRDISQCSTPLRGCRRPPRRTRRDRRREITGKWAAAWRLRPRVLPFVVLAVRRIPAFLVVVAASEFYMPACSSGSNQAACSDTTPPSNTALPYCGGTCTPCDWCTCGCPGNVSMYQCRPDGTGCDVTQTCPLPGDYNPPGASSSCGPSCPNGDTFGSAERTQGDLQAQVCPAGSVPDNGVVVNDMQCCTIVAGGSSSGFGSSGSYGNAVDAQGSDVSLDSPGESGSDVTLDAPETGARDF